MKILEFVENIVKENYRQAKDAITAELQERAVTAIEARKIEIAKSLFADKE